MILSRFALRALIVGVLVSSPTLVPASVTSASPCEALARWAEPYRGTSPTLDEMTRFDRAHQIAVFNVVAPSVRAALWQEHLRRSGQRMDLSDAQRRLIAEAIVATTPALYERQPAAVRALDDLVSRIERVFTEEQRQMWFVLGAAQSQTVGCNCNVFRQDCWTGGCSWASCSGTGAGCGWMNAEPCNGLCM